MKILIINNSGLISQNNGLYIFKADGEVLEYLKKSGHEVEILQRKTVTDKKTVATFNVLEHGIKATAIKTFKPKILNYLYCYLIGIWRILHNDFVYIYFPNNFKWLGLIAKLLGKEYGLYLRGSEGIESKTSKFLYKHAKAVFCVSPVFSKMVNDAGGKGIDKKPTIQFEINDIIRNRNYERKDKYSFLYLGRIDLDKGLVELLEAIKILRNQSYNITLNLVGAGDPVEFLKEKTANLGLNDIVYFHGMIKEKELIKNFYIDADFYVLPTYHEGFARTLCESMIFGTPVITTFVGGIPGFMEENVNALRIEPKSVESIVEKLVYAMNNYERMGELAKNGTITAEKIIDPSRPSHAEQINMLLERRI